MKKHTLIITLILFSAVLWGCKEFTGSDVTAENLFNAKYSQDDDGKVTHTAATGNLTVTINSISTSVTDSNGTVIAHTGKLEFNKSLKSTAGISIKKISGESPAQEFTLTDMNAEISFDKDDMLQKTVEIKVPGPNAPTDYIIIVDKNAEAVTGQKLDEDGDGYWGEDEDKKVYISQGTAKGFYKTGRESWSGSFNFTGSLTNETLTITGQIFSEENKDKIDQNIFVQKYDTSTDTWTTITGNASTLTQPGNYWEKTYTITSYSPLRIYSNNLKDIQFKITNDLLVPYNTNKYDNSAVYRTSVITDNDKFYGNYINPFITNYSTFFNIVQISGVTNVYKLVFNNSNATSILNSTSWSSSAKDTISVGIEKKFTGVSKDSIKVYENTSGKNILNEVAIKEIYTKDSEPDTIYFVLDNKNVDGISTAKLAIVATPALSYVFEDGSDPSKEVTLSFGHLCVADSILTKKGNVVLWKNF